MNLKKNNLIFGTITGLIAVIIIGFVMKPGFYFPEARDSEIPPALVGGPYELTDHKGNLTRPEDFRGKIMLVYFGYSFCPDVCPTDLQKITIALDILEEKNIDISLIQPIFITIDLERDSQDIIAEFVSNFHSSLIGLTGTQAQIKKAASAYRVYYQKAGNSEDEYYLMDHSSLVYVMGANGLYLSHFSSLDSPKGIAERLVGYLKDLN